MISDWKGHEILCPTPRAYPDPLEPGGTRFEPCRRNGCEVCGPRNVLSIMGAIALAPLCQAGYVTLVEPSGDLAADGKALRKGLSRAFRRISAQSGLVVPRLGVVELSPNGRPHLHVMTRKPAVKPAAFKESCAKSGLGFSALETVEKPSGAMARYVYKSVLPPAGEAFVADPDDLKAFLLANAKRLYQSAGDFWIDKDLSVFKDARAARQAVTANWWAGQNWSFE